MLIRTHQHSHRGTKSTRRRNSSCPHGATIPFNSSRPSALFRGIGGGGVSVRACQVPIFFPQDTKSKTGSHAITDEENANNRR